jgi:hypothetical protein
MAGSYIPQMDWSPLAQLGQTIVGNLQAGQKQQLLSQLGQQFGSGDYKGAAQTAMAGGDLQTAMSLFSMGKQFEADQAAQTIASGQPQSASSDVSLLPRARDAIAAIESRGSGDYSALGPVTKTGDRAYGRYGVMGANVGPWTKEVLGRSMTPQEFLANQQAQDAVFDAKFGGYVREGGMRNAASRWFTGRSAADGANAADVNGMTGSRYVDMFMSNIGGQQPVQVADASGAVPASAMPQAGVDAMMQRYQNISRALQTPWLSADTARRLQSQADMLWKQIEFVSKDANRAPVALSEGQILVDPRTGRQIAAGGPKNDVARQNSQREAEADRLGLQGEDRTQYVLNGRVATGVEKQTGEQANAATFATRMAEADKIISDPAIFGAGMGASGALRDIASSVPVVGNMAIGATQGGAAYQKFDQAKRDFVNAVLRKESGAAISSSEFGNAEKQYFPRPGDTPEVIAQKAKNRATAIDTIANAGGASFRKEFAEKRSGGDLKPAPADELAGARRAIASGVPREAVISQLRTLGFDPSGI